MIELSKQLSHAAVLKHMANHGFNAVEHICGIDADDKPIKYYANERINPLTSPELSWRIKQVVTPLVIDDFPYPETQAPALNTYYYPLFILSPQFCCWNGDSQDVKFLDSGRVYLAAEKRDKANELLIGALLQKEKQ
jgi:hypothetical protein